MSEIYSILNQIKIDVDTFFATLRLPENEKYERYYINKKHGGKRLIEKPINADLIDIQNKLKKYFEDEYYRYCPNCVHGFVKGKSIKTNAQAHNGQKNMFILKLDICDFFNSITYERINGLLAKTFHIFSPKVINAICLQVTCSGHLPQGASTSPILANMICKKLDKRLTKIAKTLDSTYTRYADDITFSIPSREKLMSFINGAELKRPFSATEEINQIFKENGFAINKSKIKLLRANTPQYICGISVKSPNKLSIKRKKILEIRHDIHEIEKGNQLINKSIIGKVSFLRYINGKNDKKSIRYSVSLNKFGIPPFTDSDFAVGKDYSYARRKYLVCIDTCDGNYGTGFFADEYLITSKHVVCSSNGNKTEILRINYYDLDISNKMHQMNITKPEILLKGEIALIKFDSISKFQNRRLKITGKIMTKEDNPVLCMGCGEYSAKSFVRICKKTTIIATTDPLYGDVYRVDDGILYKGMSGGPLIDLSSFKVIGVNLAGQDWNKENENFPKNVCSKINKTIIKSK